MTYFSMAVELPRKVQVNDCDGKTLQGRAILRATPTEKCSEAGQGHQGVCVVTSPSRSHGLQDEFLSLRRTIPTEKRAYEKWHKGRRDYAVWTIGIKNQSVQSRFDRAKAHLAEFLLKPYQRQAHITLFVCGFLAEVQRSNDDYAVEELTCHLQALREAQPVPFEIEIGGINSFATAPFLEVFDVSGGLKKTREVLSGTRSEISRSQYIPHITLGLYAGDFETKLVMDTMSSFGSGSSLSYVVNEICLATYSAQMIAGPLSVRHVITLAAR